MGGELTLGLAFLAGLAGAGHCWTMCGGLVGGLFVGCGRCAGIRGHAAYHLGRVLGYTALGVLAAALGQAVVLTGGVGRGQGLLYVLAGLAVAGVGAWLLWRSFPPFPKGGRGDSKGVEVPVTRGNSLPPPFGKGGRGWGYFGFAGLFNALMPCALVYSLAVKAMTAPSIPQGAAWLFAFGLGTVPAMAVAGALAHWLGGQSLVWLRRGAALLVLALGVQAALAGAEFFRVMGHL